jgi:cytoskeletal protein RodZ
MDETEPDDVITVGQRLREAREAKGLTVEDIAAQTRIPTRHLSSLETSGWDKLPAATYSVGFAKNYAGAVGLDRSEIGEQLRAEMGTTRPTYANPEVYEAADPARTMPKGLVFGALALLAIFVLAFTWLNNRSLEPDEATVETENVAAPIENVAAPAPPPPVASGPVLLTATDAVWIEVKDGSAILKQGQLAAGESYAVPPNAVAPVLTTGKPEALRISVGPQLAPPVGQPGSKVSGVSLQGADLLRPAAAAETPATNAPAQVQPVAAAPAARRPQRPTPPPPQTSNPNAPAGNVPAPEPGTPGQTEAQ